MKMIDVNGAKHNILAKFIFKIKYEWWSQIGFHYFANDKIRFFPIAFSCNNPNGLLYKFLFNTIDASETANLYIAPIDNTINFVDTLYAEKECVINQKRKYSTEVIKCKILEINKKDNISDIVNKLNILDCFAFFDSIVIDNSQKWCLVDMEYLPFSLFLFDYKDLTLYNELMNSNMDDVIVCKKQFYKEMSEVIEKEKLELLMQNYLAPQQ